MVELCVGVLLKKPCSVRCPAPLEFDFLSVAGAGVDEATFFAILQKSKVILYINLASIKGSKDELGRSS